MNVAYMLDGFPVISETFIQMEIIELMKRGLNIMIFSRDKADFSFYSAVTDPEIKNLIKETKYLNPFDRINKLRKVRLHLFVFVNQPFRYFKTFYFAFRKGGFTFQVFKSIPFYIRQMKMNNINHIHAHFAQLACECSFLISMITGIPFSFSVHANDIYGPDAMDIKDHIHHATFVMTCTRYNQNYLIERYGRSIQKKIYLNYHGVDTTQFVPSQKLLKPEILILSAGRLIQKKGFSFLIEAIAFLKGSLDISLLVNILGDGPERFTLEKMAEDFGIQADIIFKGAVVLQEIKKYYDQADIFVLPCIVADDGDRDGIPNVILEAMSMKLPVIATNISGIPEVIRDGYDGLLVPPNNSEALANAIKKLCIDKKLRKMLGENARKEMIHLFNKRDHIDQLFKRFNAI